MFRLILYAGIALTGAGIFFGFYYLDSNPSMSMKIVTFTNVGLVGALAFVRHVIFYRADAKELGWETERPDWMFEVGFANLAFGFIGMAAALFTNVTVVCAFVTLGYAVYLFQAAILHLYRYVTAAHKSPARLWRSVILTLINVGMMVFFAVYAIVNKL